MNLYTVLGGHLLKIKTEYKNLKKQYIQKLDKTGFQYDMAYEDFMDLPRRTASDVIKHLILLKIETMTDIKDCFNRLYIF